jgi:hypothetical protein
MLSLYLLLLEAFISSNKNFEYRIRTTNTSIPVPDHTLVPDEHRDEFVAVPDQQRVMPST